MSPRPDRSGLAGNLHTVSDEPPPRDDGIRFFEFSDIGMKLQNDGGKLRFEALVANFGAGALRAQFTELAAAHR